jgi:hypothetical protein
VGGLNPIATPRTNYLVDTDVFILWQHHHQVARKFFRQPPGPIYYSKQTRKELLHPFLSSRERRRYSYLRDHLGDALIAATASVKDLTLVTGNVRHFAPIKEIKVVGFPGDFAA